MLKIDIIETNGESDKVIMGKLIQFAPRVAEYVLNNSIETIDDENKRYKFELLDIPHNNAVEIDQPFFGPDTMSRYNRNLLTHPVTLRLLRSKWSRLGLAVYLFSFVVYAVFLALVTTLVVIDKRK